MTLMLTPPLTAAASGTVTMGAVALVLVVLGALVLGDVWSRRSVTVVDALIIGSFFVVLGAATPVGDGIRWLFAAAGSQLGG